MSSINFTNFGKSTFPTFNSLIVNTALQLKDTLTGQEISLEENSSIITDTRKLSHSSCCFIAFKGEKFEALECLLKEKEAKTLLFIPKIIVFEKGHSLTSLLEKNFSSSSTLIATTSSKIFFQQLSKNYRKHFKGPIIAISGSNGKTTTKELLSQLLLNLGLNVVSTYANDNNDLGVPQTLLRLKAETEVAVVELGSNHPGEISFLCELVGPTIGITISIGDTHLEFFRNRLEVLKEETSLSHFVEAYFFPKSDPLLLAHFQEWEKSHPIEMQEKYKKNPFLVGEHNFVNLSLVIEVCCFLFPEKKEEIFSLAEKLKLPQNKRSELYYHSEKHKLCFFDAYNANPSSMAVSLQTFFDLCHRYSFPPSQRLFILGSMFELGEQTPEFHRQVALLLKTNKAQEIEKSDFLFVGPHATYYKEIISHGEIIENCDDLTDSVKHKLHSYPAIFLKGSRGVFLEKLKPFIPATTSSK